MSVLDLVVMVLPFALFLLVHLVFNGLVYVFERVSSRSIHPPILMSDLSHHANVDVKKIAALGAAQTKFSSNLAQIARSFLHPPVALVHSFLLCQLSL